MMAAPRRAISEQNVVHARENGRGCGYGYDHAECGRHHDWLLPTVGGILREERPTARRLFDLGCGNGSVCQWLANRGYAVTGVDPSAEGIEQATRAYPALPLHVGSAYENLSERYGTFPVVVSLEVIEHVYAPRIFAGCVAALLDPGGIAIISTPYHGYLKNLALAVTGMMDNHFTALWDHGHIKFWSPRTITALLSEAGMVVRRIHRIGRIPCLAKSMVVVAEKPAVPASNGS